MTNTHCPRLAMLGPAPQAHGGIDSVLDAYRAHGLFARWPIEYLATHARGRARDNASLALGALRRFIGLLVRERGLVVHLHATAGAGFWRDAVFMALALAARCPLVLQLHGTGFERLRERAGPAGRQLIRFLLERAACIVVPCESLRVWVGSITRRARVVWVPNPVLAPQPRPEGRPQLVLFLSKLDAASGAFDLLEALARLRPAVPEVRLVFAGEGERRALARHAERLGIADAVRFTGWVGHSGRRALLESAAVFALPSYDEALSMNLLEAMAAGVPVVASPVGGVPEFVADGLTGFLVAPGDIATLQRLLQKLLLDPALGARIGAAARESVRRRCAPERVLARLEALYATLGLHAFGDARSPLAPADMSRPA